jgi:predicted MFS family arabinose efflux permease
VTEVATATESRQQLRRTLLPGVAMIAVTFGLARYGYGLLLPEMGADLGMGPGLAGLVSSGTYVSYLLANAGVVGLTSRLGPRAAVGAAAASAVVGMSLMATAQSVGALAAGVLVAGAASGLAFPPYADLVAHEVPEQRRDAVWAAISSGTGWGVALAGPLAILAGDRWRLAWAVFVGIAVLVGAVATLAAPPGRRALRRPQLNWTWFVCPRSRPLLFSAVLVGTGSAVWWVFCVDVLRDAGMGATAARIVYAACGVAGIAASFVGPVFGRLGLRRGYLAAASSLAVGIVLLVPGRGSVGVALMAALVFGVAYNSVIAAQGIWSSRVFADHPSAGLAAVNTALTIGTLLGPALAGPAVDRWGYPVVLLSAAATTALALGTCPPTAGLTGPGAGPGICTEPSRVARQSGR